MLKMKKISMTVAISMLLLFAVMLPALADENDSCTVSSDGTQTCVITDSGSGGSSDPGNPGTVEPLPVDPVKEEPPVVEEIPVVEEKPVEEVKPVEVPTPTTETPVAPDETGEWVKRTDDGVPEDPQIAEDGIIYTIQDLDNKVAVGIDPSAAVAGLGSIVLLGGFAVYAIRSKKK